MKSKFLCCALAALIVGEAAGETYVTRFVGTIDRIQANDGAILGDLQLGQMVSGYFTFDDSPAAKLGSDRYAAKFAISLPTVMLVVPSNYNYIRANNNISRAGIGVVDLFSHAFDSVGPMTGPDPYYLSFFTAQFIDTDATVFNGTPSLPVLPRNGQYEIATWSLGGTDLATRRQQFSVSGTITAIVPEPATMGWAASLAALGMLCGGRRLKRPSGAYHG
jgi:hypothetical protein